MKLPILKKFHWTPDLPDYRDHEYANTKMARPPAFSVEKLCSPIENQLQLGSCTGNGIVGIMEMLENKFLQKNQFVDLSRLFVYYNERVIEGTVNQDSGARIRDGIKSVATQGVCSEFLWPYDITKFKRKPTKKCYKDALQRKITEYSRLISLDDMRDCIANGFPFVFGFSVYESFETEEVARTGMVPMPSRREKCLGGHCVDGVAYDDKTCLIKCRNSYGKDWGDEGFLYLPYDYVDNIRLATDFWTIRK